MVIEEKGITLEFASRKAPGPIGHVSLAAGSSLTAIAKVSKDKTKISPWGVGLIPDTLEVKLVYQINDQHLRIISDGSTKVKGNILEFRAKFPALSDGDKIDYYFRIDGLGFPFPSPPPSTVQFQVAIIDSSASDSPTTPGLETGPISPVVEELPSDPTHTPEPSLVPPVLLLPLKLETRFIDSHLWIRFIPDPVMVNQFTPSISKQESIAIENFRKACEKASKRHKEKVEKAAWRALVQKVGVYRAAWLVQNREKEQRVTNRTTLEISVLPDQFDIFLYTNYEEGKFIHAECKVNCGKTLKIFQEKKPWETNFAQAEELGLATKIPLETQENHFDRIIVVGHRTKSSSQDLSRLLDAHRYTQGVAFLPYGTPTNNTELEKTPYTPAHRRNADNTYSHLVQPLKITPNSWAKKISTVLGIPATDFQHDHGANQGPNELEQSLKSILWWSLGHHTLQLLVGKESKKYDEETQRWLWEHYQQYVAAQ